MISLLPVAGRPPRHGGGSEGSVWQALPRGRPLGRKSLRRAWTVPQCSDHSYINQHITLPLAHICPAHPDKTALAPHLHNIYKASHCTGRHTHPSLLPIARRCLSVNAWIPGRGLRFVTHEGGGGGDGRARQGRGRGKPGRTSGIPRLQAAAGQGDRTALRERLMDSRDPWHIGQRLVSHHSAASVDRLACHDSLPARAPFPPCHT